MKKVQCFRTLDNTKQSLGVLIVTDETGVLFVCRTLELPYKNNAQSISSFNPGKYTCKYTMSPSFKIKTYEVTGVPGRAGVRIHSANYVSQLRGCIALGDAHKDINADGLSDVTHSGNTIAAFEKLMNYEDFELEIIKAY
ncbi:MAG: DUF5675 family protein [Melioribacteraceae bacterium]